MKVTNNIVNFITKRVNDKVAPVSIERDYEAAKTLAEDFAECLSSRLDAVANAEFERFLEEHPELEGSKLLSPITSHHKFHVSYTEAELCKAYREQIALRREYVNDIVERVSIDATRCKSTEEILVLIDEMLR